MSVILHLVDTIYISKIIKDLPNKVSTPKSGQWTLMSTRRIFEGDYY
jgi:hypothetical protein